MKKNTAIRDASYDWGASGFCGPTSLSALTGLGTATITLKLRRMRGTRRPIKGMSNHEMVAFLKKAGYKVEAVVRSQKWERASHPTLARWIDWHADRKSMYLVHVGYHYVVYQAGKMVCTSRGGVLHDAAENKYMRCKVKNAWRIS